MKIQNPVYMPVVSVLMPLYNTREDHLREAIESILGQTFMDFEFLILNDSPDNVRLREIVASYSDPRIRYIENQENLGISSSRNRLLKEAVGEFVAVMDHDDISLPQRLEKQLSYLRKHPDVDVVSSYSRYLGKKKLRTFPVEDSDIKEMMTLRNAMEHSATMMRKSLLVDNGIIYRSEFFPAEDYALNSDLMKFAKFHNIPEVLLLYREHGGNTTHLNCRKMHFADVAVKAEIRTRYPQLWAIARDKYASSYTTYLFGFIPFLKIVRKRERSYKIYLFGFILLFKIK